MEIYCITNLINGKQYVGQTIQTLKVRFAEHCRKDKGYIGHAIQKHGKENFIIELLDTAQDINELNEKEIYWIARLNTVQPQGYNLCYGGGVTIGYKHKLQSRRLMSVTKKRNKVMQGKNNHFYGKNHTEESRAKMSAKWQTGERVMTEEHKEKMRRAHFTRKVRNVTTGEVFDSVKQASEKHNLKDTHITRVCKGKRKSTGGYKWEYVQ